jgi:hypothetical protein
MEWLDRVSLTYSIQHLTSEARTCDRIFFMKIVLGCYMDVGWSTTKIQVFFETIMVLLSIKTFKTTNLTI